MWFDVEPVFRKKGFTGQGGNTINPGVKNHPIVGNKKSRSAPSPERIAPLLAKRVGYTCGEVRSFITS